MGDKLLKRHSERCKNCKTRILELLEQIYGAVHQNYCLDLPSMLEGYSEPPIRSQLAAIYNALKDHRGHAEFVRANKLPRVDFFIPEPGFVLEFDESQHFTRLRQIALLAYTEKLETGYIKSRWIELCGQLNKKDNDPPFRDEQRAWYDTLRDFAPGTLNINPTVRLYASDYVWCSLDASKSADKLAFEEMLGRK